jgi:hypothetical protein
MSLQPKIKNGQVRTYFNGFKENARDVSKAQKILRAYNHPFRQGILAAIASKKTHQCNRYLSVNLMCLSR